MSTPTFLIDSSLVATAVGASTPDHIKEFEKAVAGGKLIITVYVRMEAIRRVVCDLILMAQMADQCDSVSHFWYYYGQDFHQRRIKTAIIAFGLAGSSLGQATTPRSLAEEFAQLAINFLKLVDRKLPHTDNRSQCQIGARKLVVDYNNLLRDAGQFLLDFSQAIEDCGVNDFVKFHNPRSGSNILISDPPSLSTPVVTELKTLRDAETWITCKECKKLGDAIIALEQPNRATLVHGDSKTFPYLCNALKKKQKYVESVQAVEHKKSGFVFKLAGKLPQAMPPST